MNISGVIVASLDFEPSSYSAIRRALTLMTEYVGPGLGDVTHNPFVGPNFLVALALGTPR